MNFQFYNFSIFKRLIFCAVFLSGFLLWGNAQAACSNSGSIICNTASGTCTQWTAASASQSDVSDCVTDSSAGDTINVPAGDGGTYSTYVNVNKAVSIIGAGTSESTGTRIAIPVADSKYAFYINGFNDQTAVVRISGFRFSGAAAHVYGELNYGIYVNNKGYLWNLRIDNNYFKDFYSGVALVGNLRGVVDGNTFHNGDHGVSWNGSRTTDSNYDTNCCGTASWHDMDPLVAGTSIPMFIENNLFKHDNNYTSTHYDEQISTSCGGFLVVRYNTFDGTELTTENAYFLPFMAHGNQGNYYSVNYGNCTRAQPLTEFYNNYMNMNYLYQQGWFMTRGGSVIVHDNTALSNRGSTSVMFGEEECYSSSHFPTQRTVWPAEDQNFNSFLWDNYLNSNLVTSVYKNASEEGCGVFFTEGQEYFFHEPQSTGGYEYFTNRIGAAASYPTDGSLYADTGTLAVSSSSEANAYYPYTPYTCPHPLTGLTGSCDEDITGTEGYNIESDTISPAAPSGLSVS